MVEKNSSLTVEELLTSNVYVIPLYQRNFSWTYDELSQLVNDVVDAYLEQRENYYIGTLVVNQNGEMFEIIDGQQRTIALTLLSLALKNSGVTFSFIWERLTLQFPARKKSQQNLQTLFVNQESEIPEEMENEITLGYRRAKEVLKRELTGRGLIEDEKFIQYFFHNVILFRSILPSELDLNLYFERFNSRGEQLEAHEIIKAQMMAKFGDDQAMAGKFAKIWDACADFNKPVIQAFQKKVKRADNDLERERVFPVDWLTDYQFQSRYSLHLDDELSQVSARSENKQTLLSVLEKGWTDYSNSTNFSDDELTNYTTIVNFETFLYYVYYLTFGDVKVEDIQLDDKKLLKTFETVTSTQGTVEDVIRFAKNLLTLKFIFDNLIIRMAQETMSNGRRQENEWFLQKVYRNDVNQKKGGNRYVQYRFDRNSFENCNNEILMLQSMFAVTFTANRDSRWLYESLQFLFHHIDELHQENFGYRFKDFLESLAVRHAQTRLFNEDGTIKSYQEGIPVYAFNFIDYLLWKSREKLKVKFEDVAFDSFRFAYRTSIEHWYPQNPIGQDGIERLDEKTLHSIGNLCLISDSQNSKFGNLVPAAKYSSWKEIFPRQSLKLQMMAEMTHQSDGWSKESIEEMEWFLLDILSKNGVQDKF